MDKDTKAKLKGHLDVIEGAITDMITGRPSEDCITEIWTAIANARELVQ